MPSPTSIPEGIRSGLNAGPADLPGGRALRRALTLQVTLPAAADDPLWGVAMATIPVGSWGDVQTRGVAIITAGAGGFSEGDRLMAEPGTGKAVVFAAPANASASLLGIALTTTPADGQGECELAGPAATRHA